MATSERGALPLPDDLDDLYNTTSCEGHHEDLRRADAIVAEYPRIFAALSAAEARLRDANMALHAGALALSGQADRDEHEGFPTCAAENRCYAAQLRALTEGERDG